MATPSATTPVATSRAATSLTGSGNENNCYSLKSIDLVGNVAHHLLGGLEPPTSWVRCRARRPRGALVARALVGECTPRTGFASLTRNTELSENVVVGRKATRGESRSTRAA